MLTKEHKIAIVATLLVGFAGYGFGMAVGKTINWLFFESDLDALKNL